MGAPNPWHHSLPPLDPKNQLLEGEHPLDMIRELLMLWPGEETVKIHQFNSRHDRLVQIVGGYPEILSNRFPLDWPLHPQSLKAMRLSRYLDSLSSPVPEISLRSALLNKDASLRRLDLDDSYPSLRRFLALLLIAIREDYGIKQEGFTDKELRLLGSLHSSESGRIDRCWPWDEIKIYNESHIKDTNSLSKKLDPFWNNNEDLIKPVEGRVWGIKFQKIQSWILHWSASKSDTGLTASLIRGASSLIENTLSSIRHSVIKEFGVGSIIIDGGGRLEFVSAYDPTELLNNSVSRMFGSYDTHDYTPTYGLEIKRTLERWDGIGINELDFYNELASSLPPYNIYQVTNRYEKDSRDVEFAISNECPLCNEKVEIEGGIKTKWTRLVKNIDYKVCDFHTLLYYVGQGQRYLDSTIRNFGKGVKSINKQRRVTSIARIDLNSLGIIFTSPFGQTDERPVDIKRRRSFRFNSHWWQIIHEVVDSPNYTVDQVAAWMAAGDDIILAEYQPETDSKNSESALGILLTNLAFKLSDLSDEEFGNYRVTFSGGLANRVDESLQQCLERATDLEELSKFSWRGYILQNGGEKYLMDEDGNMKTYVLPTPLLKPNAGLSASPGMLSEPRGGLELLHEHDIDLVHQSLWIKDKAIRDGKIKNHPHHSKGT